MIYLDNAATTFKKPPEVYRAIMDCMINYGANPGRSGHKLSVKASEKVYECRDEISSLFNINNPSRVLFALNATEALNTAIKGVLFKGDHVIFSSMEHNSVVRPIYRMAKEGVSYDIAKADVFGNVSLQEIESKIKPETKLIVLIHVSNVCGTVNNIAEIGKMAKKRGILFLVDVSQSAGVLDIDVERDHIDMLAFPGHKALMGPQGTGGLYIREGVDVNPLKEGGTGSYSMLYEQPEELPDKFESGTLNSAGICGLCEGVKFIKRNGIHNILSHEKELTQQALEDLSVMKNVNICGYLSNVNRTGVISVWSPIMDSVEIAAILNDEYNIAVRAGYHCAYGAHVSLGTEKFGTVRMSVGAFNTKKDIKYFCESLYELINLKK